MGDQAGAGGALPRPQSVEDLVGGLWKLGRTPSEAEFTQFLAAGGHGGGGPADGESPTMHAAMGLHRVASIDLLRKMILNQQAVMSQAQAAVSAEQVQALAAASGLAPMAGVPLSGPLLAAGALPVVFPQVLPDWGKVLAGRAAEGGAALAPPASAGKGAKAAPAKTKESARAKAAKERAAAAAAEAAEDDEEELDEEEYDEADVLKSMGKGPFTAEDIRRQRRMLSNRESARRSRRRKLEHVHTLQQQINGLRAEGNGVAQQLRDCELRLEAAMRENVGLKGELDRLAHQILEMGGTLNLGAGGGPHHGGGGLGLGGGGGGGMPRVGSMPRVPSAERLTKRLRDESPVADSPRGFVPFRSLRSYENLLSLQAAAQTGSAALNSAAA